MSDQDRISPSSFNIIWADLSDKNKENISSGIIGWSKTKFP